MFLESQGTPNLLSAIAALIGNAMKFSTHGGNMDVTFGCDKKTVTITVRDEGFGILPEALPHIFGRFYHMERPGDDLFGGPGIGLAITQQVIAQQHGALAVEGRPTQGSTFMITLPVWAGNRRHPG